MTPRRVAIALCLCLSACSDDLPVAQRAASECRRLALIEESSNTPIRGAEDLAVTPDNNWLVVSAYDRWAAETAVTAGHDSIPRGHLYLLPITKNLFASDAIAVTPAARRRDQLDLRPHGIDLIASDQGDVTLAVINRRYERENDLPSADWRQKTTLELFDIEDAALRHRTTIESDLLCRANDVVALTADEFLVTRDHHACNRTGVFVEDVSGLARGKLIHVVANPDDQIKHQSRIVAEGLAFPNGIAVDGSGGWVYVAETRGQAIQTFRLGDLTSAEIASPISSISLPSGPDNLTLTSGGDILAAAHTSLVSLGLYRNQWFGIATAASRIVSVSPDAQSVSLVYDDPDGALYSAATSVVDVSDHLIAGSVADEGLLVCSLGESAQSQEGGP